MSRLKSIILFLALSTPAGCSQHSSGSQEDGQSKQGRLESLSTASNSELLDARDDPSAEIRRTSQ